MSLLQKVCEDVKGVIVGPDADNRVLDVPAGPQELDGYVLSRADAFALGLPRFSVNDAIWVKPCHTTAASRSIQFIEALAISEKTVERHISNVLLKLEFNSRTQIAAWAVEKRVDQ